MKTNFNTYNNIVDLSSLEIAPALTNNKENTHSETTTHTNLTISTGEKSTIIEVDGFKPLANSHSVFSSAKSFLKLGAVCFGAKYVGGFTARVLTSKNICLGNYIPDYATRIIKQSKYLHEIIDNALGNTLVVNNFNLGPVLIAPALEELTVRLFIQELLLKKFPKAVITKISKDHASLVDSKIAKMARILISSAIFGLMHYTFRSEFPNMSESKFYEASFCLYNNRMISSFITGLVYGSLQEVTGNVAYPILAHTLNNSLALMASSVGGLTSSKHLRI